MAQGITAEAWSEVTEGLLLYASLQLNHLSRSSVRELNPTLGLWIGPTGRAAQRPGGEAQQLPGEFQVQILASGLGCYYLDGSSFLNTTCEHGSSFSRCLSLSFITDVQLFCRCIGEHSTVTCCSINPAASSAAFQETVITRPEHFNPATILIKFKINLSIEQLKVELSKLRAQLYLMHITNPEISLKFTDLSQDDYHCVDGSGPAQSEFTLSLLTEPFKHFPKTRIKLVTSLRHFYNQYSVLSTRQMKLRPLKGDAYTIPASVSLTNGSKVTLKVYCAVAVVPHLSLRSGRKIPANRLCKHVNISVFGPNHLPLIPAGSTPNFPLTSLAEWDSYGMELRQSQSGKDCSTVIPSYACEITNLRTSSNASRTPCSSSLALNHHLQLFVFLEDSSDCKKTGLGKNSQWKQSTELHHRLRGLFQKLVVDHSKKFHQAIHSALNKLICNYGSYAKTKSIMATAIPLIADAVAGIIKNSTNGSFKESCRDLMKVGTGETAVNTWVAEKLWKIAGDRLGAMPPSYEGPSSTPNPDEPTSPELIIAAAGEQSNSQSASTVKGAESATAVESHMEHNDSDSCLSIEDNSNQSHPSSLSANSLPGTNKHNHTGLFQARIASRVIQSQSQYNSADDCNRNEDFDFEALSSFEDVRSLRDSSVASDSDDETVASDFDELRGVSDRELSFCDQSPRSQSPLLLSTSTSTHTMHELPHSNIAAAQNHSISVAATAEGIGGTTTVSMDVDNSTIAMSMDIDNTASQDETNFFDNEDCMTGSTIISMQDFDTCTTRQTYLQNVCNHARKTLIAANVDCDQHIPEKLEEAQKWISDCCIDDCEVSHLSDREWTELSFASPEFLHGNKNCSKSAVMCTSAHPITSSPNSEQHVPGRLEEAKQTTDDIMDDDEMSHLSDKEWTELSFASPDFLRSNNGGPNSTTSASMYATHPTDTKTAEHCILHPNLKQLMEKTNNQDNCEATLSSHLHNSTAFDLLEDYEETLSMTIDSDAVNSNQASTSDSRNSTCVVRSSCDQSTSYNGIFLCDHATYGEIAERGGLREGALLTCVDIDITEDDFCWESA